MEKNKVIAIKGGANYNSYTFPNPSISYNILSITSGNYHWKASIILITHKIERTPKNRKESNEKGEKEDVVVVAESID